MINLDDIYEIVYGKKPIPNKFKDVEIKRISTDSRTIQKGDFYIPLKGEKFDGEEFIKAAVDSGAVGYLYTNDDNVLRNYPAEAFKVDDTKEIYLKIANWYRKKINPKVIMITGSSGKTTTKELVYSVVSQKYNTVKTALNHNNEIGFCQTVFSVTPKTEVLIVEAGMRGLGEIELISKYAEPDISVITNVGTAHIGRLGSRENIAKAKCEITAYQNKNGALVAHDDSLIKSTVDFDGEKIFYSLNDVEFVEKKIGHSTFIYKGNKYELNIEGDYNVENSLAAINIGSLLNIDYPLIKKGLTEYSPIEKRWEIQNAAGYKIINDSYNANPESMKSTLNTVFELYPDSIVVLGDMGELGVNEAAYHKEIGEFINNKKPLAKILTVGNLAKNISDVINVCFARNFQNNHEAARYIFDNIPAGITIFLKASRTMKFENIIENLKNLKGENK